MSRRAPTAIAGCDGGYPDAFPFDPDEAFPEHPGQPVARAPNPVYRAVRESFRLLGLDAGRHGRPDWNPLGGIIQPGQRVFLKPNLVTHEYRPSCGRCGELFAVITHPSVVRAVADYAAIALRGRGEIVIGDNPSIDADWEAQLAATRLDGLPALYRERRGLACRVLDLRPLRTGDLADYGIRSRARGQAGDPEGEEILNLGEHSCFHGRSPWRLRGVFTNRWETIRHHWGRRQEYSLSATILNSDVYISIPKLKTHHKVGTTLNTKGLVGICANKNLLPHWRVGYPSQGGDEYPAAHRRRDPGLVALRQLASDLMPDVLRTTLDRRFRRSKLDAALSPERKRSFEQYRGAWEGNDTCWRMAADLYNLFVRDVVGWRERSGRRTRFFSVVDGVLAGEGDGPFCPAAKPAGVIVAGADLLLVDLVASRLMDFRVAEIPYLAHLVRQHGIETERAPVVSDRFPTAPFFDEARRYLGFRPPAGWNRLSLLDPHGEPSDAAHHPCRGAGRAPHAAHPQHAQAAARHR